MAVEIVFFIAGMGMGTQTTVTEIFDITFPFGGKNETSLIWLKINI